MDAAQQEQMQEATKVLGVEIDHSLFNELGIDSQGRVSKFGGIKRKVQSVYTRIEKSESLKQSIKEKYSKIDSVSEKEFFLNLFNQNPLLIKLIDLLLYASRIIDEKTAINLYEGAYSRRVLDVKKIVFDAYFDKEKDLLRKIHYAHYLQTQKHIEVNLADKSFENSLIDFQEEQLQNLLRNTAHLNQKEKINVWYVLKSEYGIGIFIYIGAKTRKKIPSTIRKRNQFIPYSKPYILYLKKDGKKVSIYSKDVQRNIKLASVIVHSFSKKSNEPFKILFETKEERSKKVDVNKFIEDLLNNRIDNFVLEEISFYPDKAKFPGTLMKLIRESGSLKEMINEIRKSFSTTFSTQTVSQMSLAFRGFSFNLNIIEIDSEVIISYNYYVRNQALGQEVSSIINKKYSILLNKRVT